MNAPQVQFEEVFYFLAFIDLATCRLYEGGPIPYYSIADYATRFELDQEETEVLTTLIRRLDDDFRTWWKANMKD